MLTISPYRVADIHALNLEFLQLVVSSDHANAFGILDEVAEELRAMSDEALQRVAQTDVLLFSVEDGSGETLAAHKGLPELVERVHMVARDFSREDAGLAVSYLGMTVAKCQKLLGLDMRGIREQSAKGGLRCRPLGTTAFRLLGQLATPAERTQYVTVAAND